MSIGFWVVIDETCKPLNSPMHSKTFFLKKSVFYLMKNTRNIIFSSETFERMILRRTAKKILMFRNNPEIPIHSQ
jgi:hypothetical protein